MSHGAIENLVLESPTTPTISSVSSELSFEDIQSVDEMASQDPIDPKAMHPTLYEHDDMVTFKVEGIFFRKPAYFFTESSAYFVDYFRQNTMKGIVELTDPEVSSTAFTSLLHVLHPPLGVTPISTLTEWTDVLHLSSKWGFEHLRSAAIKAILPLSSAVDKLVLGRKYGFDDWVPGAYADLLEREEDLTMAEGKRMDLEDILAIARGRREARTRSVKSRADIEGIVKSLLPRSAEDVDAGEALDTQHRDEAPPSGATPTSFDTGNVTTEKSGVDVQAQISQWVDQGPPDSEQRSTSIGGLLELMQDDRTRVPLVVNAILSRGLEQFTATCGDWPTCDPPQGLGYINTWPKDADGNRHGDLLTLDYLDKSLGLVRTAHTEATCLRLVNQWRFLQQLNLDIPTEDLLASEPWKSFVCVTKYLTYLVDGPASTRTHSRSVVSASVFSTFWSILTTVHRSTVLDLMLPLVRATQALLNEVGPHVSNDAVCAEMDAFYIVVKDACDAASRRARHPTDAVLGPTNERTLAHSLTNIIRTRHWPSA